MKTIAIVTLYDNINIGNKLQNYAVQEICKSYGFKPITLSYKEKDREITWRGYLAALLGYPKKRAYIKRLQIKRRKRFEIFSKKYLSVGRPVPFKEYFRRNDIYDAYIVGSDQVWHKWTDSDAELDYFFLKFANPEKRLCIAPSFGLEVIPKEYIDTYREGLLGFSYLSCREESGCKLIKEVSGREAERIIDPTMVLTKERWQVIEKKPEADIPERYMLVYFLGERTENVNKRILKMAEKLKLSIVDIFNMDYPQYFCTTPDEFIFYISRAEYIYTNSFHGTAFSIIFHKRFTVDEREDDEGKKMRSRLDTILTMFNLSKCRDTGKCADVDFSYTDMILCKERIKAQKYLDKIFCK